MAEADRLRKAYDQAVGEALELGIKVYVPGTGRPGDLGPWAKSLGTLRDEIRAARGITEKPFEFYLAEALDRAERY